MTEGELRNEAVIRYWNDPVHHARVKMAVMLLEQETPGGRFDAHDRSLATLAASLALVVQDQGLPSG